MDARRFYASEKKTKKPAPDKTLDWDNHEAGPKRAPFSLPISDSDFRALLKQPAETPKPKEKRKSGEPNKRLEWDDYDDIPERGSFPPPLNESAFHKLLEQHPDEDPRKRSPGAPPLRPRLPLGRPDPSLAPAGTPTKKEDDACPRVHVLGVDPRAYFIAFELAGCRFLDPVKLLVHKRIIMNNWEYEGKRLLMCAGDNASYRSRAKAEWVGMGGQPATRGLIEQLIVTLPCSQTKVAIQNIRHRINSRTTICLVQDGLGVVEELNDTLFKDPTTRPTFILGHMTASIGFHKPIFFSSVLKKPGKLYLTALERGIGRLPLIKFHPPVEARSGATGFMHTLATVPNLGAGAYGLEGFLVRKLPAMVFHCVIEPLAVALDGSYEDVLRNGMAMQLADDLLEEIFNVIWAMPELINGEKVVKHCGKDALRKYAVKRLLEKGPAQSQYLSRVRAGRTVDIDYLNGYFVKRGQELGIKMPQNEMMIDVVKARVEGRKKEVEGLIPMESMDSNVLAMN